MSFALYLGGIVVILGGLVLAAALLNAPTPWIVAGALVVLGAGVLSAVAQTRGRDKPS